MKKIALFIAIASFLPGIAFSANECTLNTGWEPWSPYQYIDESGKLTGLDVELVSAVIKHTGCKVTWKETPWVRQLNSTENGTLDLTSGASFSTDREKWAYFSAPYRQESMSLFVRRNQIDDINLTSIEGVVLVDFEVGMVRGTYYGDKIAQLLEQQAFKDQIQFVSSESQNFKKLLRNRIDGYISDTVSGIAQLRENNLTSEITIYPMPVYATDIHVMFSKREIKSSFVAKFNASIQVLRDEGIYKKILDRYTAE